MSTLAHMTLVFRQATVKDMTCNLDFESNLGLAQSDLDLMGNAAVAGWAGAGLRAIFTSETVLKEVLVYAYDVVPDPAPPPIPGPQFQRAITIGPSLYVSGVAGSQVGQSATPQVSLVVSFKTAVASRRARGRIYAPPPAESDVDAQGVLTAVRRDQLMINWNAYIDGIQNSAPLGQTYRHAVVGLRANTVNVVTSRTMKRRVDTQRRRLSRALDTL